MPASTPLGPSATLASPAMKRVAILFVLTVFVPSLVLAWLAVRSLRDQQFVLERQQSLLYQGLADRLARDAEDHVADRQREFVAHVESLLATNSPAQLSPRFDDALRKLWPLADVGFVVNRAGKLLSPSPTGRPEARAFHIANAAFFGNREAIEVYWNVGRSGQNQAGLDERPAGNANVQFNPAPPLPPPPQLQNAAPTRSQVVAPEALQNTAPPLAQNASPRFFQNLAALQSDPANPSSVTNAQTGRPLQRVVNPQLQQIPVQPFAPAAGQQNFLQQNVLSINATPGTNAPSRVATAEAEFRQLTGEATEGTLARFIDNKLKLMFWYRPPRDPDLVFGVQLQLPRLIAEIRPVVRATSPLYSEVCVALLDDTARPVTVSHDSFQPASWKRPFVATEIGEALPHWEMAVYPLNPAQLSQSARTLALTIGLQVAVLLLAIGIGGWLIVADLRRHLTLARQKTDFVSNVSHELKTPLTSIRLFAELLAEGRVTDAAKQRSYLQVITAEAARLTRLINNVLDFARLERGEKSYTFTRCDLAAVVSETVETYRPHLEQAGFKLDLDLPPAAAPTLVNADRDALAQVLVNLLSNAEKYSADRKEIRIELRLPVARHSNVATPLAASHPSDAEHGGTRHRNVELLEVRLPVARHSNVATPLAASQPNDAERGGTRHRNVELLEVRVLDRGLGVPPGTEARIFEQFYRAHDSLSSGIQGSGLGLTLARQIARAHGGEITCEARAGGGSCFTLRLPAAGSETGSV